MRTSVLLGLIISLFMMSCNFKEEIFIDEDGSGSSRVTFDGSQFMSMAKGMGGSESEDEEDSAKEKMVLDTTFVFKDLLIEKKDSIAQLSAEEQAELKEVRTLYFRYENE